MLAALTPLMISCLCCLSGMAVHALKDFKRQGLTVQQYFSSRWIDLLCTALVSFTIILAEMDTIEPLFAFSLGYTSNSGIDWILKKPSVK